MFTCVKVAHGAMCLPCATMCLMCHPRGPHDDVLLLFGQIRNLSAVPLAVPPIGSKSPCWIPWSARDSLSLFFLRIITLNFLYRMPLS